MQIPGPALYVSSLLLSAFPVGGAGQESSTERKDVQQVLLPMCQAIWSQGKCAKNIEKLCERFGGSNFNWKVEIWYVSTKKSSPPAPQKRRKSKNNSRNPTKKKHKNMQKRLILLFFSAPWVFSPFGPNNSLQVPLQSRFLAILCLCFFKCHLIHSVFFLISIPRIYHQISTMMAFHGQGAQLKHELNWKVGGTSN